jgi:tetratricopeptide (TPR) repeat protein
MSKFINIASSFIVILGINGAAFIPEVSASSATPLIAQGQLNAEMFNNIGLKLIEQKKFPEAIEAFSKSLEYFPDNNADAYFYRGQAYLKIGELAKTTKDFSNAIKANPRHLGARVGRGMLLCMASKKIDAPQDRKTLRDIGSADLDVALEILTREGMKDQAELVQQERNTCQA